MASSLSRCEVVYNQQDDVDKPRIILSMAIGDRDDPTCSSIVDCLLEFRDKNKMPKKKHLLAEANRRCVLLMGHPDNNKNKNVRSMIRPKTAWSVDQIIDWLREHPRIGDQASTTFVRQTLRSTYPGLNPDLPQPLSPPPPPPQPVMVGLSPQRQQSPPSDSMTDLHNNNNNNNCDRNKNAREEEKESNRFHEDLTMRTPTTAINKNNSWEAQGHSTLALPEKQHRRIGGTTIAATMNDATLDGGGGGDLDPKILMTRVLGLPGLENLQQQQGFFLQQQPQQHHCPQPKRQQGGGGGRFVPTDEMLLAECQRRAEMLGTTWRAVMIQWLTENPIQDVQVLDELLQQVLRLILRLKTEMKEEEEEEPAVDDWPPHDSNNKPLQQQQQQQQQQERQVQSLLLFDNNVNDLATDAAMVETLSMLLQPDFVAVTEGTENPNTTTVPMESSAVASVNDNETSRLDVMFTGRHNDRDDHEPLDYKTTGNDVDSSLDTLLFSQIAFATAPQQEQEGTATTCTTENGHKIRAAATTTTTTTEGTTNKRRRKFCPGGTELVEGAFEVPQSHNNNSNNNNLDDDDGDHSMDEVSSATSSLMKMSLSSPVADLSTSSSSSISNNSSSLPSVSISNPSSIGSSQGLTAHTDTLKRIRGAGLPTVEEDDAVRQERIGGLEVDVAVKIGPPDKNQDSVDDETFSILSEASEIANPTVKGGDSEPDITYFLNSKVISDREGRAGKYTGKCIRRSRMRRLLPHGKGLMEYKLGISYDGHWSNGRWEGHGKLVYDTNDYYAGTFREDLFWGHGVRRWPDGSEFEGGWKAGKRSGRGTFRSATGDVSEGGWCDDKLEGRCVRTFVDGSQYEGLFVNGARQGDCKYRDRHGVEHEGSWVSNRRLPDGSRYDGLWKEGKANGYGKCRYENGDKYEGRLFSCVPIKRVHFVFCALNAMVDS